MSCTHVVNQMLLLSGSALQPKSLNMYFSESLYHNDCLCNNSRHQIRVILIGRSSTSLVVWWWRQYSYWVQSQLCHKWVGKSCCYFCLCLLHASSCRYGFSSHIFLLFWLHVFTKFTVLFLSRLSPFFLRGKMTDWLTDSIKGKSTDLGDQFLQIVCLGDRIACFSGGYITNLDAQGGSHCFFQIGIFMCLWIICIFAAILHEICAGASKSEEHTTIPNHPSLWRVHHWGSHHSWLWSRAALHGHNHQFMWQVHAPLILYIGHHSVACFPDGAPQYFYICFLDDTRGPTASEQSVFWYVSIHVTNNMCLRFPPEQCTPELLLNHLKQKH
jgi:hypothetical protein